MRQIVRYGLIAVQIMFIFVLVYQFENMEKFAEEIKLTTKIEYIYYGGFDQNSDLYVDYDINTISQDAWDIEESLPYNRPVYVTLVKNDQDIHEVKTVTKKKPKLGGPDTVIVKANYSNDDDRGQHYVYYGFESLENTERFGTFKEGDQLFVTILLGKWGQQKVTNIEAR